MDRNRDGSRRASYGGGHVSAPRRPRSYGFKDSSAVDDDDIVDDAQNSRLRDRSKKDSNGIPSLQGNSSNSMTSGSMHKRKRQLSKTALVHSCASPTVDMNEAIEDSEMVASDGDDDLLASTIARRPGKLRSQRKILDEGNAVSISAVPRKVRTAVAKRPHESTYATLGNSSKAHSRAAAALRAVPITPPTSASSDTLKLARRTKPNGAKLRCTKNSQVSAPSVVSEQEVEVAEALFDLARMVPKQRGPMISERKFEVASEGICGLDISADSLPSSPQASLLSRASTPSPAKAVSSTSPVSSSLVSSPIPAAPAISASKNNSESAAAGTVRISDEDANKQNLTRVRTKVEDVPLSHCQPKDVSAFQSKLSVFDPNEGLDHTADSVGSHRAQLQTWLNGAGQSNSMLLGDGHACSSVSMATLASDHQKPIAETICAEMGNKMVLNSDCNGTNSFDRSSTLASSTESKTILMNTATRGSKHTCQEGAGECKPRQGSHSYPTQSERGQSVSKALVHSITHDSKGEIDIMACPLPSSNGTIEKLGISLDPSMPVRQRDPAITSKQSGLIDKKCTDNLDNEDNDRQEGLKEIKRKMEDVETLNQASLQILKTVKSNSKLQQLTDMSLAAAPVSSGASDFISGPFPPSTIGPENWQGRFHDMGYYAPVAAAAAAAVTGAWPEPCSISSAVCLEAKSALHLQVPPFGLSGTLQTYKRCMAHVYIAHFIDVHQQMCRHPLWATMYKKFDHSNAIISAGLPIPCDAMLGIHGSEEKKLPLYMDISKRGHTQQSTQEKHQEKCAQAGPVPMFGYSVTDTSASSSFSGSLIFTSGNAGAGNSTGLAPSPASVISSGMGASNGNVVSAAAAQAQHLQAVIQQAGSPFSFPHGHFGASLNALPGNITQKQPTQLFGNHFYNPPLIHPLQSEPRPSAMSASKLNLQQGAVVSRSESKMQQQPQSQSQQHVAAQQLQPSDRDNVAVAESKCTSLQRHMFSQGLPDMQVPSINTSSPVIGAGRAILPSQKPFLEGNLCGKQHVKSPKQQTESSLQHQAQHQLMFSQNAQQHPNSGLHMNLKGLDVHAPQAFLTTSMGDVVSRTSVGPGPLGLAPVAAVIAPQGHVIIPNNAEDGGSHSKVFQEQLHHSHLNAVLAKKSKPVMELGHSNIEESLYLSNSCGRKSIDHKRIFGKQTTAASCPRDLEAPSKAHISPLSYSYSGIVSACTPGNSETSFNSMVSPVGNLSSRPILPAQIGFVAAPTSSTNCNPNVAMESVNLMPNMTISLNEAPSCSFSDRAVGAACSSVMSCHGQVECGVGRSPRKIQTTDQHLSPGSSGPRMQLITTGVSTVVSGLAPGIYTSSTAVNHPGQPARCQWSSLHAMPVSRLPSPITDTCTAGSLPTSPSYMSSKLSSSIVNKTSMLTETQFNPSQKQLGATMGKTSGPVLTHSSESVLGSNPITTKVGEYQSQQIQPLHQHGEHRNEHKKQHQQYLEHSHHQQVYSSGGRQPMMQYGQQILTNQVGPHSSHIESLQSQFQAKSQPFLQEQQLQFGQHAESYLSADQQAMPHHTQQVQCGKAVQHQTSGTAQVPWQYPVTQHVIQQAVLSMHQPFMFPSLGAVSSGAHPHMTTSSAFETNISERMKSSDGAANEAGPIKSSRNLGGLHSGSRSSKTNNLVSSFVQSHVVVPSIANSSPQPSFNQAKPLPYLRSVSLSSSSGTMAQPRDVKCVTGSAPGRLSTQASSRIVETNTVSSSCPQGGASAVNIGGQQTSGSVVEEDANLGLVISGSALQAMPSGGNSQSIQT